LTVIVAAGILAALAASPSAAGAVEGFQSPSHNIGCVIAANGVRCDIAQHSWSPPPTPSSCPLDYGNGINLGKHGRASFTCAGDTVLGIGPVLPYGQTERRGRYRCKSKFAGVLCVNRRNGHGFFLSRQKVRLF
jgi:hypothetical protein